MKRFIDKKRFESSFRYMMQGLTIHELEYGIPGYGLPIHRLDISGVIDVKYRKRLFSIMDRKYPYTIHIKYHIPRVDDINYPYYPNIDTYIISRRYDIDTDAIQEMNNIISKKEHLMKQYLKLIG